MAKGRRWMNWLARALIACLICVGPGGWALADADRLILTAEDYLPVYRKADTDQKIIAITIDDMYQTKNAEAIVDLAIRQGAKLTLFPVGENALRGEMKKLLCRAYENGFEIENHTYSHVGLYQLDDEEMAREVYLQSRAVDAALGVRYQQHFFRPYGGDGLDDQRTHLFAKQMGMCGIAYWTVSGSDTPANQLIGTLAPGNVYLFHTTDADTMKLQNFLPAAVKEGYQLVTMNELFGLPQNETAEFQTAEVIPALAPYRPAPRLYRKGDFMWAVYDIQARLFALGYLNAPADGVYGDDTVMAVENFQQDHGLPITGVCDMDTQSLLFIDAQNEN